MLIKLCSYTHRKYYKKYAGILHNAGFAWLGVDVGKLNLPWKNAHAEKGGNPGLGCPNSGNCHTGNALKACALNK
jgi:hypothetical protein